VRVYLWVGSLRYICKVYVRVCVCVCVYVCVYRDACAYWCAAGVHVSSLF